jgi:DNA-binding phage protein
VLASRADRGRSGENEGEGHMTNKTTDAPFNVLDYLTTSAMIDAYVAEAYASGDSEYIAEALQTAAIARDRIKTAPQPTPDRG